MVESKLTALPILSAINDNDVIYIVDDPGGDSLSKQATMSTVKSYIGIQGINVGNFGAKGDGITDDTAAIQMAIDTAIII